ncbi:MAG: large-conductance mechanosensitive channel protein MscL [Balneolaceae bacterium]|nr:large-conductance mechanosensitive channel protein MscL [Balneolaceae bacterium]
MGIIKEFKEFAIKGNMFDMAVGIIIGTAFNNIVSSLVKDIITPLFGFWIGDAPFQDLKITLKPEIINDAGAVTQQAVSINYGVFLESTLDFLIIAFTIFLVIKTFNKLRSKSLEPKEKTVPTRKDIELLSEIRDLLREQKG